MNATVAYAFGTFRLVPAERRLTRDGHSVPLTPKAFDTLVVLVERHGHLVTKDELFKAVWPDAFVEENNLVQHVSVLRRTLAEGRPDGPIIETVPKCGYRFVGAVVEEQLATHDVAVGGPRSPEPRASGARDGDPQTPEVRPPDGQLAESSSPHALRVASTPAASGWLPAAGLALVLALVAGTLAWQTSPIPAADIPVSGVTRVAVLPFSNVGSPGDDTFVAGLTEEIASRLARLHQLALPSSTTIAGYDRHGKTLREVGADLGVQFVIEGSVQWARGVDVARVRITPRLVRVSDDTAVWTQQYDATLDDLFSVQADIGSQIIGALQVALGPRERRALALRPTADSEAYLAYLHGLAFLRQEWSDTANLEQALSAMDDAVSRDPQFAQAWSWLGRILAWQYRVGVSRSPETRARARHAAETALQLAAGSPDAHLALAELLIGDRDYDGARRHVELARVAQPNSAEPWRIVAFIDERTGRWREARTAFERGFDLDPGAIADDLGVYYLWMRQYPEALRYLGLAHAANRLGAVVPTAWARFSDRGDVAKARQLLEPALEARSPADGRVRGLLARLEWFDGNHQRALDLIADMDAAGAWLAPNFRFPASLAAGQVYESMGRNDDARRSYETAARQLIARQPAQPDDYQIEAALAIAAAGLARHDEAIRRARRAVELVPVSRDAAEGTLYLYILAAVQSRAGAQAESLATLEQMFAVPGFYGEAWTARDPWFAGLRPEPAYRAAAQRWATQRGDALLGPAY